MYVIKYHNAILIIIKRKLNKYKLKLDKRIFYDFQNKHIKTITTCFSTIFVIIMMLLLRAQLLKNAFIFNSSFINCNFNSISSL